MLAKQPDILTGLGAEGRPKLRTVVRAARWRVALFAAAMLFGAQLAVPFFTPYMLQELKLSLFEFALLSCVVVIAKVIAFPIWRRAQEHLPPPALAIIGVLIAVVPAC